MCQGQKCRGASARPNRKSKFQALSRISSPIGTQGLLPQVLSPSKTFSHLGNQSGQDMTSPQHRSADVHAWDPVPKLLVNKTDHRSHPEYLMMTHALVTSSAIL